MWLWIANKLYFIIFLYNCNSLNDEWIDFIWSKFEHLFKKSVCLLRILTFNIWEPKALLILSTCIGKLCTPNVSSTMHWPQDFSNCKITLLVLVRCDLFTVDKIFLTLNTKQTVLNKKSLSNHSNSSMKFIFCWLEINFEFFWLLLSNPKVQCTLNSKSMIKKEKKQRLEVSRLFKIYLWILDKESC